MHTAAPLAFAVNRLTDIHAVQRRTTDDDACIAEIKAVLKRHDLDKKYGLTLLHKHFDLEPGEIMVEHTDVASRTLTSRPAPAADFDDANLVEVTWSLDSDHVLSICAQRCFWNYNSSPQH